MGRCCGEYFPHWNRERELHPPTTWGGVEPRRISFPPVAASLHRGVSRAKTHTIKKGRNRVLSRRQASSFRFATEDANPSEFVISAAQRICRPWGENRDRTCNAPAPCAGRSSIELSLHWMPLTASVAVYGIRGLSHRQQRVRLELTTPCSGSDHLSYLCIFHPLSVSRRYFHYAQYLVFIPVDLGCPSGHP